MPDATRILSEKRFYEGGYILSITIWGVPEPVSPSTHPFKYSLFLGRRGERLVGYDNERGKGDHKHIRGVESPYEFVSLRRLVVDFVEDAQRVCGIEVRL
jgi:hypothetical protein